MDLPHYFVEPNYLIFQNEQNSLSSVIVLEGFCRNLFIALNRN